MPFDYEQKFCEEYAKNVANIHATISSGKIDHKMENFCKLHGFNLEELKAEIKRNKFLAACFAINPNKQNFYELAAAEYINLLSCVGNFKKLSTSELYIISGEIFSRAEAKAHYKNYSSRKGEAKTIDFAWKCGDLQFYAAHKYTKQDGGAQGNQYKDLQTFIRESVPNNDASRHFIAIADGVYYQNPNGLAGLTRMEKMRELADSNNVHVCTIDELEALLLSISRTT